MRRPRIRLQANPFESPARAVLALHLKNKKAAKSLNLAALSGVPKGILLHMRRPRIRLQANPFESPARAVLALHLKNKKAAKSLNLAALSGVPKGIRTPVLTVKG